MQVTPSAEQLPKRGFTQHPKQVELWLVFRSHLYVNALLDIAKSAISIEASKSHTYTEISLTHQCPSAMEGSFYHQSH